MHPKSFVAKARRKKTPTAIVLFLASALWAAGAASQEAVTDATLRGVWPISGSAMKEVLTFAANGEFTISYTITKKDGKEIPPRTNVSDGAYKLAAGACTVGAERGNLWMVKERNRCCFNAYLMGRTLVLDAVRGSDPFIAESLCGSKTLKRDSEQPKR